LWLKFRATRLPGAPGERIGRVGQGDRLHLLAIGDSIIDGVGTANMGNALPVLFAGALSKRLEKQVHWRAEGHSGLDIHGLLQRLDSLDDQPADVVLISIGVNDVTGLTSVRQWQTRVNALLDRLRSSWPSAQILFAGLPPMSKFPLLPQPLRYTLGWRAEALDSAAAAICSGRPNVHHIPTLIDPRVHTFSDDGYHPSSASCAAWARELAGFVRP